MTTATRTVLFPWKESYSVKIALIDTHHKKLVQLINDLYDAMLNQKSREETGRIIAELVSYTKFHFSAEEQLMLQNGYRDYVSHKMEHESFTAKIVKFNNDYNAGGIALTIGLMSFLKEWLQKHILESDQKYSPYLKAKGVC